MTSESNESSGLTEEVMSSINGVRDALSVRRVFGEPYEVDGTTVIPVAKVIGGAGGGGGEGHDGDEPGSGFGGGFGMRAKPVGVYEVRDGETTWKPALDVTTIAKRGQALGGLAMVCLTFVFARRRR